MKSKWFKKFVSEQDAATSVEYAIMLGLIILVCIVGIRVLGAETATTMTSNSREIVEAIRQ